MGLQKRYDLTTKKDEFEQNYMIYRYGLEPIKVNEDIRQLILVGIAENNKFVHIGMYTIFLSSISGIEPVKRKHKKLGLNEVLHPKDGYVYNKLTGNKVRKGRD